MIQKLSTKAKKIWRTRTTIIYLLFAFLCGGFNFFFPDIPLLILLAGTLIYLFVILVAIPYVYKMTTLDVRKDGLTITKGVIMKKRIKILADRIQYVELYQTPLQRAFDVFTVAFHTAGATVYVSQVDADLGYHFRSYTE